MAYDFSTGEPGPIAPLAWVEQAVEGTKQAVDDDSKLVLGVPMYGYNWVVATEGTCPPTAEGRTGVTARSVDDLIARRGATPVRDEASGEWTFTYELEVTDGTTTCTQSREVHYVDADGARARIDLAREAGLGGVALWALGYETDGTWVTIDDAIRVGTTDRRRSPPPRRTDPLGATAVVDTSSARAARQSQSVSTPSSHSLEWACASSAGVVGAIRVQLHQRPGQRVPRLAFERLVERRLGGVEIAERELPAGEPGPPVGAIGFDIRRAIRPLEHVRPEGLVELLFDEPRLSDEVGDDRVGGEPRGGGVDPAGTPSRRGRRSGGGRRRRATAPARHRRRGRSRRSAMSTSMRAEARPARRRPMASVHRARHRRSRAGWRRARSSQPATSTTRPVAGTR